MKVAFFGHRDAAGEDLRQALSRCTGQLVSEGATEFYLGGRGGFDLMAAEVLKDFRALHPDIRVTLVIAYLGEGFDGDLYDGSLYPPLEGCRRALR